MALLLKLALAITLIGILGLLVMMHVLPPVPVGDSADLSKLTPNEQVITTGKVISERTIYETTKLIKLDNNIELVCDSCPSYANKTVRALGTMEEYLNKTQISILKIKNK
jgi:hypothetical protein